MGHSLSSPWCRVSPDATLPLYRVSSDVTVRLTKEVDDLITHPIPKRLSLSTKVLFIYTSTPAVLFTIPVHVAVGKKLAAVALYPLGSISERSSGQADIHSLEIRTSRYGHKRPSGICAGCPPVPHGRRVCRVGGCRQGHRCACSCEGREERDLGGCKGGSHRGRWPDGVLCDLLGDNGR